MASPKKKTYQINNLKILWSINRRMWLVRTPDGRTWDQFRLLSAAKAYAKRTKDFVRG